MTTATKTLTCTNHHGFTVEYDPELYKSCPMCGLECKYDELRASKTVTMRIDESSIPVVVDALIDAVNTVSERISLLDSTVSRAIEKIGAASGSASANAMADPLCPKCGSEMQVRHRRDGSGSFWSCITYPKCNGTRPFDNDERKIMKDLTGAGTGASRDAIDDSQTTRF